MYKSIILLLFFTHVAAFSQKDSLAVFNLFENSKKLYENSNFKIKTAYKTYVTKQEDSLILLYKGEISKRGRHIHNRLGPSETILEKGKKLTMSHSEKVVNLSSVTENATINEFVDIKKLLPFFKTYTYFKTADGFKCEFIANDINFLPFSKVQINFRPDYSIKSQILQLTKSFPYQFKGEEKKATSRVEFYFSELKPCNSNDYIPPISNYVVNKASSLVLKQIIKDYRIIN